MGESGNCLGNWGSRVPDPVPLAILDISFTKSSKIVINLQMALMILLARVPGFRQAMHKMLLTYLS